MKLYVEGGGEGRSNHEIFRQGWGSFLRRAGLQGQMPQVIPGGGREQTFDKFNTALQNQRPDEVIILLVDSEGPVTAGNTAWQHLRNQDNWDQLPGADDDSAHLMVQVMETWFLADRDALRRFFGPSLNENRFREWPNLEDVPSDTVMNVLAQSTRTCQKPYRKGRVSFELLSELDPQTVAAACPHADQLLTYLRTL
ncbi:MAG: DUF4276 family protein [Chloroflexota bacterium]|nr:DUF4276 family protein [Chloroflexota bacterium]MDE2959038.1 DUF4276 family protein [Chloroflexota bacterium]